MKPRTLSIAALLAGLFFFVYGIVAYVLTPVFSDGFRFIVTTLAVLLIVGSGIFLTCLGIQGLWDSYKWKRRRF